MDDAVSHELAVGDHRAPSAKGPHEGNAPLVPLEATAVDEHRAPLARERPLLPPEVPRPLVAPRVAGSPALLRGVDALEPEGGVVEVDQALDLAGVELNDTD